MGTAPSPQSSGEMEISVESGTGQKVVRCSGKITAASTELLIKTVRPLFQESKSVVLDLSGVSYLDSSGLGAIMRLWATSKQAGSKLSLINLSRRLKDLFTLTNLSTVFENVEHSGM